MAVSTDARVAALEQLRAASNGMLTFFDYGAPIPDDVRLALIRLYAKAGAVPGAPMNLAMLATQAMDQWQALPLLGAGQRLSTDQRWQQISAAYKPIAQAALAKQAATARAEAEKLASNTAFWNSLAKYSGADYLERVWDDLWAAVDAFKTSRQGSAKALAGVKANIDKMGPGAAGTIVNRYAQLISEYDQLGAGARTALLPLGPQAAQRAGLGAAIVILGVIAATVVVVTAALWDYARRQANNANGALTLLNDSYTAAEAAADAQYKAGQITAAQREEARQQNVTNYQNQAAAAGKLVEAGNAAAGIKGAASAVSVAIGVTAAAVVGYLLWRRFRKKGPARAPGLPIHGGLRPPADALPAGRAGRHCGVLRRAAGPAAGGRVPALARRAQGPHTGPPPAGPTDPQGQPRHQRAAGTGQLPPGGLQPGPPLGDVHPVAAG